MNISVFGTYEDLQKKLGEKKRFTTEDCPFCRDLANNKRILWRGQYWGVILNDYPYIHTGQHIMLIPIRHVKYTHELTANEWSELGQAHAFIEQFYREYDYFSFTRESMANRSVEHVHTHFLPGKIKRSKVVELLGEQGFETKE